MTARRQPQGRQCARCGRLWPRGTKQCPDDGTSLVRHRWKMGPEEHRRLRGLAHAEKGLSDEELHNRMQALTTKTSTKQLTRRDYWRLIYDLKKLPSVQRGRAAA